MSNTLAEKLALVTMDQLGAAIASLLPVSVRFKRKFSVHADDILLTQATGLAALEISRHMLVWYFATLSQVSVVYGSLTTAIAVLLSLDIAATLLLLGAQVISEYERIGRIDQDAPPSHCAPANVRQSSSSHRPCE